MARSGEPPRGGESDETAPLLRDAVVVALRRAILTGELAPGTKLGEVRLSEQFQVSRVPVREAVLQLQAEGLVHIAPRRSAVVTTMTQRDARELFQVRRALEPLAARLAADQGQAAGREPMRRAVAQAEKAVAAKDGDRLTAANIAFHGAMVQASGNALLARTMEPIESQLQRIFWATQGSFDDEACTEHRRLLEAITAGDATGAERLAAEHVDVAERQARPWIASFPTA